MRMQVSAISFGKFEVQNFSRQWTSVVRKFALATSRDPSALKELQVSSKASVF